MANIHDDGKTPDERDPPIDARGAQAVPDETEGALCGHAIARYAAAQHMNHAAIAAWLGIDETRLNRLAVCWRPSTAKNIAALAKHFTIAPDKLALMLTEKDRDAP